MGFLMRYIRAVTIAAISIFIFVAGCLSQKHMEESIAAMEDRKMYVGEKERRAIDENEETIRSFNSWWVPSFGFKRKYPRTMNDNVQDVIEERDRKIRSLVDNVMKQAESNEDHKAQPVDKSQ